MNYLFLNIHQFILSIWPLVVSIILIVLNIMVTIHAILYKREVRAAIGWIGLAWLSPGLGAVLYYLFGINRISRRARRLYEDFQSPDVDYDIKLERDFADLDFCRNRNNLKPIARLVGKLTDNPLSRGNSVLPLYGGDEAYGRMLEALETAEKSVTLSTYIFDYDRAGEKFMNSIREAHDRGVKVRVLIDDIGAKYSSSSVVDWFYDNGVPCQRFMRSLLPWHMRYYNLRNHRKIMVVDGAVGFTGGMNIREGTMHSLSSGHSIDDIHFQLQGPVVSQLQFAFMEDWAYTCGETLDGPAWFPKSNEAGDLPARGISDGPDEDYDKLEYTLLGALSCADQSIKILTPYFLPDRELHKALKVAALRGVKVDVVVPEKNNLRMVQWASQGHFGGLLKKGVNIYVSPPPFDHSKLMIVDNCWTLLGSSNWDPRSLKLNFEFNVEVYGNELAEQLTGYYEKKKTKSRSLTLSEYNSRSYFKVFRDNTFRLASPYL